MHGRIEDFWPYRQERRKRKADALPLMYGLIGVALILGAYAGMRLMTRRPPPLRDETPRALLPSPARRRTKIDRWTAY